MTQHLNATVPLPQVARDADSGLHTAQYVEDANLPGYWLYGGLRIQADIETHRFVVEFARQTLPAGASVLDVAAGEGALSAQLADIGFRVSATTWNDKCRAATESFHLDLDHPFGPADVGGRQYPLVCAIEIIEHVESPASFLRQLASVVSENGRIILSTPNVENAQARLQWLLRGCPAIFDAHEVQSNRHISMLWRQGLHFLLDVAGLEIESTHLLGGPKLTNSPLPWLKRAVYAMMGTVCTGDLTGSTRLYVLRTTRTVRTHGAKDVY
jgi:hypothetical protein